MRSARDFMTPNPRTFSLESTLGEVAESFVKHTLTSAPVVDHGGKLVGVVSEVGLLKAFVMDRRLFGNPVQLKHRKGIVEPVQHVLLSDPIEVVLRLMIKGSTHRIAVVDLSHRVQGVISPKDFLRIVEGGHKSAPENETPMRDLMDQLQKLNQSLQTYKNLHERAPYMMHSVDKNGKIVAANHKFHEVLGYENHALIGHNIRSIYPAKLLTHVESTLADLSSGKERSKTVQTEMLQKNGDSVLLEVQSSSLVDENGAFISTISISRPIEEVNGSLLYQEFETFFSS